MPGTGKNQHGEGSCIARWPDLPQIIQDQLDKKPRNQKIIVSHLHFVGIPISLRQVQRIITDYQLKTARKPRSSPAKIGAAIEVVLEEDPLGRWGARTLREKVALHTGEHATRDFCLDYQRARDPEASFARDPKHRRKHRRGLWSAGPHEEWCMDGHEKLVRPMGIYVYGANDKCTRSELGLYAVPSARTMDVPVALYLLMVKKHSGVPIQLTVDKGPEVGKVMATHAYLRNLLNPEYDANLPAAVATTSTNNITRERGWRPLWERELENVLAAWRTGQEEYGYDAQDLFHKELATWLWARIVQDRLDRICYENAHHHIRKQAKIHLPSDCRPIDVLERPEQYGVKNQLISLPPEYMGHLERLLEEHTPPDLFRFASDDVTTIGTRALAMISVDERPLKASTGWWYFRYILNLFEGGVVTADMS